MKKIAVLIFCLFVFNVYSYDVVTSTTLTGRVESADIQQSENYCVVVIVTENDQRFGIIEDIYDCYYTRQALDEGFDELTVEGKYLSKMDSPEFTKSLHLQFGYGFYLYSDYE